MYPTQQRNEADIDSERNSKYSAHFTERSSSRSFYYIIKRSMDIICALTGLVFLTPLFLIISILIKLEDPKGSIFFCQIRIGKDNQPFRMYKFRSMVSNAEELLEKLLEHNEISGAMFKMKGDPRITGIGKFIRRTSIDELPQLWNVIRGEMSLVGPRPALPREVEQYSNYDRLRLRVIPGCTGLWQISGRNELSFSEMVELDLQYINKQSIFFDITIILRTLVVMSNNEGAY